MAVYPGEMYGHSHLRIETVKMFAVSFIVWHCMTLLQAHSPKAQAVLVALLRPPFICKNLFAYWLYPSWDVSALGVQPFTIKPAIAF